MTISNYGSLKYVNTSVTGHQYQASIAGLGSGQILVAWLDANLHTIRAQFYDALGNVVGTEFALPLTYPGTSADMPRIEARPGTNGYYYAYSSYDSGTGFYRGTLDGYAGTISESGSAPLRYPVGGGWGNSWVLLMQDDGRNGGDIIFDGGVGTVVLNTATAGLQTWPDFAVVGDGSRFVASWWDDQTKQVKFRLFGGGVNPLTPEIVVGAVGNEAGTSIYGYRGQGVAALTGGNFVIVWHSDGVSSVDTNSDGIQASIYNANGGIVHVGIQVNATTAGSQRHPSVVGLPDGGFAVAWQESASTTRHVVLRTFDASGNPTSGDFVVDGAGHADYAPQLTLLADGRLAVTWEADQSLPQDPSGWHTEMQIVDPRSAAVRLTAVATGSDFVGTRFNDTFIAGSGNDRFTGNGGFDTASYAGASGAVVVDLRFTDSQNVGGGMGTDLLNGIGGLTGSGYGDQFSGNSGANVLAGLGGNDTLNGNDGGDTLDGGAGTDTLNGGLGNDTYVLADGNDVVQDTGGTDLVTSTITRSLLAGGLTTIENLTLLAGNINGTGNNLNNLISGSAGVNVLTGGVGADTLRGLAGNDVLIGGLGIDVLTGGLNNDVFQFSAPLDIAHRDAISDFTNVSGNNDSFQLANAVMTKLGAGVHALNPAFFRAGTAALDANDYVIYNKTNGALSYDSNGNAAGGVTLLATLTTKPTLTAADFLVI
jgi:Ca2+-binding RTX toxin-like protein